MSAESNPTFRLLLIDDDDDVHPLVADVLRSNNIEVMSAFDGEQGVVSALEHKPDLILLDYDMPGSNGLQVLRNLRCQFGSDETPVMFITGSHSHKVLTACFQAGAADYIRKPFCAAELLARVNSILDRRILLRRLEQMALHDPLTGLCNRASIRIRLQSAISRLKDSQFALLYLDFDHFKLVNDKLGHEMGDDLLLQISERLRNSLRCTDSTAIVTERTTACRLGGDEFVILLENLRDPQDAIAITDRLVTILREPYCLAGHHVCCTASIGIVNNVLFYTTPDAILRDADTAMYEAKSRGKGCFAVFNPAMHAERGARLNFENQVNSPLPTTNCC